MTEKISPLETNEQEVAYNEQEVARPVKATAIEGVGLSQKEIEEIQKLEYELKYANSKKPQGEKFNNTVTLYSTNHNKQPGTLKRFALGALAGIFSMLPFKESAASGNKHMAKTKTESFPKDTAESRTSNAPKPYEQTRDGETIGHITIEGHTLVPQKDTTKEVYVYYFSDDGKSKNNLEEILGLMKKRGFVPANGDLLNSIYDQNKNDPEFNKKIKWVMAPTPEGDEDDTRAQEGVYVATQGKTAYIIPEHSVFPTLNPRGPGRFEIDQGFNTQEYGLLFYTQTNADTNAGFAKK